MPTDINVGQTLLKMAEDIGELKTVGKQTANDLNEFRSEIKKIIEDQQNKLEDQNKRVGIIETTIKTAKAKVYTAVFILSGIGAIIGNKAFEIIKVLVAH